MEFLITSIIKHLLFIFHPIRKECEIEKTSGNASSSLSIRYIIKTIDWKFWWKIKYDFRSDLRNHNKIMEKEQKDIKENQTMDYIDNEITMMLVFEIQTK